MTSPTFAVSGSAVVFTADGTAVTFAVEAAAVTFDVTNVAGYMVAVTELDQLSDVDTAGKVNGDALLYDAGSNTWGAGAVTAGGTASMVLVGDVVGTAVAGTVTTDIAASGVTAGTYGSAGSAVVVTVAADGRVTAISGTAISGGGASLPSQTGNAGAVLGTDGTDAAWVRTITAANTGGGSSEVAAEDGLAYMAWSGPGGEGTGTSADDTGARVSALDGANEAEVRVNLDGTVEITATGAVTVATPDGVTVETDGVNGKTVTTDGEFAFHVSVDSDVSGGSLTHYRSRGSLASPTAVVDGDTLAYLAWVDAHDGTDFVTAARVTAVVDGTVGTGEVPAAVITETADDTGTMVERIRHSSDGTTDITGALTVNGAPVSGGGGSSVGGDLYLYANYT